MICVGSVSLFAGQKTWNGSQNSNWTTAGNWTPSGVPASSDTVDLSGLPTNGPNIDDTAVCAAVLSVDYGCTLGFNTAGKTLTVYGDFHMNGGATVSFGSAATLNIQGTFLNGETFIAGSGTVILNGSDQLVYGNATTFNNLTIINTGVVAFAVPITVNGALTLTSGRVSLTSDDLTVAGSLVGGSSTGYVQTAGTGSLIINNVGASDVLFPVGTASTYSPVTINNAGTVDNFSVRVQSAFNNPPIIPSEVVNRQWTIAEATQGGSDATLTFQWGTANEASGFIRTNPIYIGRYDGTHWGETPANYTDLGGGVYTASASGFASFSAFGVGNAGALPIQLASAAANVVRDNDVEIVWKTVSETNNYGFEVYRKRGESGGWSKIGFVHGHGTTLVPQSYSFVDQALSFGKYSYYIKQIDLDGKSETLPAMEVTVGVTPDQAVLAQNYPNPFNPSTVIEFSVPQSGYTTIKAYNVLGQEVATLFEGNAEAGKIHTAQFNASSLPSGLYFYTLRSAGKTETKRMTLVK